jgi:hypothetical protein
MSYTWKLLPLAVFAALGALMLFAGGDSARPAQAAVTSMDIDDNVVTIEADADLGDLVIALSSVENDTTTDMQITDCNGCQEEDENDDTELTVDTDDADFDEFVEVTLTISCPDSDTITITATQGASSDSVEYDCEPTTPTATATGTVGAARTVVVTSANQSLGCANTTIITITVRGANGQAVAAGTVVSITASIGAVSPTSGQTTADGSVFVFYTAPQNQGGTATITALAGSATGTANITVNCASPTTAPPPPTTAAGGSIQPPNTGDAGLADAASWSTYAGIALIVVSVIGTLAVVRPRA